LNGLTFDRAYESANGIGHGARFRLNSLDVGQAAFTDVDVSVNGAAMSSSLLGMTFLKRLKSFQFADRKLILRW
jgi:aspartyl protease family protein